MSVERIKSAHVATSVGDDAVSTDSIADEAVTYAKIQDVSATDKILGRDSSGAGVIEEISPASLLTMIGVEASADVTDTTNVTAAGALMDSELAGIAAVKATTGTFLSADESKLDGIEASATADQTAGEVLTLIEDGVDSVHYKDNSVDAVHLFDLARGSVLIGNASAATAELTIGSNTYVLSSDGTDITWTAAGAVSGAQTGITTILNTSTKIGRDTQNLVDFATTDNKIIFRVNNVDDVEIVENALQPTTNNGAALGTTALGWSDVHIATGGVINWVNGQMTITETSADLLTVAGGSISATAKELSFDPAVAVNNVSGITATFTAGEDVLRGAVCYFKAGDSKMWHADANLTALMPVVAMAAADIAEDAAGLFLLQGFCHDADSFPTWDITGRLYVSGTPGVPTQTAPSSDGDFVQDLGWAVSADAVYFNPSGDVIEHA